MMTDQIDTTSHSFSYDGKLGPHYKIFLANLVLSIITLGIYHFWARRRIRRYLAANLVLNHDRFEYTGYGKELFWGSVKALIFLLIISIPVSYTHLRAHE